MIAVDTNLVVRLLTGDDPAQEARARAVFEADAVFLPKTVLLESEWVLRKLYKFKRDQVATALRNLLALPNIRCEDEPAVIDALTWSLQGLDFADALHLASSGPAERFATFDTDLIKAASRLSEIAVVEA